MTQETNNLAADLWALADLLRGDFKQSQYGRVILPFALLRRLECVLEGSKPAVLAEAAKVEKMAIAEEAREKARQLMSEQIQDAEKFAEAQGLLERSLARIKVARRKKYKDVGKRVGS